MAISTQDRFRGCLLGLAVGDALGTTLEFAPRGSFEPIDDLVGGGPFNLQAGQWTDDTSLALCLAASLVECRQFDARDQMNRYLRWLETGYLSSTGRCFDVGTTTYTALMRYRQTQDPFSGTDDPRSASNGCIMRLAPVAMFFFGDIGRAEQYAALSSRTTHGSAECIDSCRLFARMLVRTLGGSPRDDILHGDKHAFQGAAKVVEIAQGGYLSKSREHIRGGFYVVESLEAALWCFATTDSFLDALLTAVNLGDDADTTGAVCGQIAGAFYGYKAIPQKWLDRLAMSGYITELADRLYQLATA